ncbi:hypothetical protein VK792_02020 [Mesobacterium sp. TK19101]|uniref:Uncharacterized protein n=1 Tax=Mesobacterium hydrothermale TaxID=3111907 RepID=A0ABU6HDV6_9RHOB|nr:hypothetical protein [Mesobacterium sp. TK19101]MEC3860050.1 hypothetical protein [Mesobacterium sp. TK19101]
MTPRLPHILLALLLPVSAQALSIVPPVCSDDTGAEYYDVLFHGGGWRSAHVQGGPLDQGAGYTYVLASCRTGQQVVVTTEKMEFYEAAVQTHFRQMIESETRFSMQDVVDVEKELGRQARVMRFDTRTCLCKLKEEDEG